MKLLLAAIVALGTATSIASYFLAFQSVSAASAGRRRAIGAWSIAVVALTLLIVALEYRTRNVTKQDQAATSQSIANNIVISTPSGKQLTLRPCMLSPQLADQGDAARRTVFLSGGDVSALLSQYGKELRTQKKVPKSLLVFYYRQPERLERLELELVTLDFPASWLSQMRFLGAALSNGRAIDGANALRVARPEAVASTLGADLVCGNSD